MKKLYHLFIFVLLGLLTTSSFACPSTGTVYLMFQSHVTNYAANGGCSVINGDLFITDAGEGPNNRIYSLKGLESITTVNGYVYVISSSITSFEGLNNLSKIAMVLTIQTNPRLESFEGLNGLRQLGYLFADTNPMLKDMLALTGITTMAGINIRNNAVLASLAGFEGITTISTTTLDIQHNPLLTSIDGFRNLTTVPTLRIENNASLSSINLLNKITYTGQVYIKNNPQLITCDPVCNFLKRQSTSGGIVEVSNNGTSCASIEQMKIYCASPLPVSLISFTVKKEGKMVKLVWTTSFESNSREFVVQHSTSGKDWHDLGTVPAMLESKNVITYSFVHNTPSHKNYYRLKIYDRDNSYALSTMKQIQFADTKIAELYPNPASDFLVINSDIFEDIKTVTIVNQSGITVYHSKNAPSKVVDIRHFNCGLYFVMTLDKENRGVVQRFAVTR